MEQIISDDTGKLLLTLLNAQLNTCEYYTSLCNDGRARNHSPCYTVLRNNVLGSDAKESILGKQSWLFTCSGNCR